MRNAFACFLPLLRGGGGGGGGEWRGCYVLLDVAERQVAVEDLQRQLKLLEAVAELYASSRSLWLASSCEKIVAVKVEQTKTGHLNIMEIKV